MINCTHKQNTHIFTLLSQTNKQTKLVNINTPQQVNMWIQLLLPDTSLSFFEKSISRPCTILAIYVNIPPVSLKCSSWMSQNILNVCLIMHPKCIIVVHNWVSSVMLKYSLTSSTTSPLLLMCLSSYRKLQTPIWDSTLANIHDTARLQVCDYRCLLEFCFACSCILHSQIRILLYHIMG